MRRALRTASRTWSSVTVNDCRCCCRHCGVPRMFHNRPCLYLAALPIGCEGSDSELFSVIFPSTMPGVHWGLPHIGEVDGGYGGQMGLCPWALGCAVSTNSPAIIQVLSGGGALASHSSFSAHSSLLCLPTHPSPYWEVWAPPLPPSFTLGTGCQQLVGALSAGAQALPP